MNRKVFFGMMDKDLFETYLEKPISDKDWEQVADELDGRVNNYIDSLLQDLVEEYR